MLTWTLHMDGREKDLKHSGVAKREMLKATLKSLHFSFVSEELQEHPPLWGCCGAQLSGISPAPAGQRFVMPTAGAHSRQHQRGTNMQKQSNSLWV